MSALKTKTVSRRNFLFGSKFCKATDGATAIEYGLIGGIVGVVGIIGLRQFSSFSSRQLNCVSKKINGDKTGNHCEEVGIKRDLDFFEDDVVETRKK